MMDWHGTGANQSLWPSLLTYMRHSASMGQKWNKDIHCCDNLAIPRVGNIFISHATTHFYSEGRHSELSEYAHQVNNINWYNILQPFVWSHSTLLWPGNMILTLYITMLTESSLNVWIGNRLYCSTMLLICNTDWLIYTTWYLLNKQVGSYALTSPRWS